MGPKCYALQCIVMGNKPPPQLPLIGIRGSELRHHSAGAGPSHGDGNMRKNLVKIESVWFGRYARGQTDRQTDVLITILRHFYHSNDLITCFVKYNI